jgi:hypothetical protein
MIPPQKRWYWIAGTALACAGVLVARIVTPNATGNGQGYLRLLGMVLALGGLFVILLGTRRRG